MKHKIRGRDGGIREAIDDYVLREGETLVVVMPFIHFGARAHDPRRLGQSYRVNHVAGDRYAGASFRASCSASTTRI